MTGGRRALRRVAVAVLVLLGGAAATGCGVPGSSQALPVDPADVPEGLVEAATTTTSERPPDPTVGTPTSRPAPTDPVQLFFVRSDRLVPVTRRLPLPLDPAQALGALVAGPDAEAEADGLRSALVGATPTLTGVEGGTAMVELPPVLGESTGEEQRLALAQLVYTLTGLPGIEGVAFAIDGEPVAVPRADGSVVGGAETVDRDDYAALVTPA